MTFASRRFDAGASWERGQPIRLEGVRVRRGATEILRGVDVQFDPGRRYIIVGPSGAGKSTMLRLLNRLEDPSSGTLRLGEVAYPELRVRDVRSRVGVVFQAPRPLPGTLSDNLTYPFHVRGLAQPSTGMLAESLQRVGIDPHWLHRDVAGLSGGERQRLAIAVALIGAPEILVMDEPTSALDPSSARSIATLLADLAGSTGLRTIAVTHHRGHAALLGETAVRMESGRVVDVGERDGVISRMDADDWQEPSSSESSS